MIVFFKKILLAASLCLCAALTQAEQVHRFGGLEMHYILIPTTMLKPDIAASYNLTRGKDRALLNISVLEETGRAITANFSGSTQNLLGQRQDLSFAEGREGEAIYYLAVIRHANEEVHRLQINAENANGKSTELKFSQKLYWSD